MRRRHEAGAGERLRGSVAILVGLCIVAAPLAGQDERESLRAALKAKVDLALARGLARLRQELHDEIDAALGPPPEAAGHDGDARPADTLDAMIDASRRQLEALRRSMPPEGRCTGSAPPAAPSEPARLGVTAVPIPEGLRKVLAAPEGTGILVVAVDPGSAAAAAGLVPGEAILHSSEGRVDTPADLERAWAASTAELFLQVAGTGGRRIATLAARRSPSAADGRPPLEPGNEKAIIDDLMQRALRRVLPPGAVLGPDAGTPPPEPAPAGPPGGERD